MLYSFNVYGTDMYQVFTPNKDMTKTQNTRSIMPYVVITSVAIALIISIFLSKFLSSAQIAFCLFGLLIIIAMMTMLIYDIYHESVTGFKAIIILVLILILCGIYYALHKKYPKEAIQLNLVGLMLLSLCF